jgi:hypothetical protein
MPVDRSLYCEHEDGACPELQGGACEFLCPTPNPDARCFDDQPYHGHCRCWDDGEGCCRCKAPPMTEEQKREQGMDG